MPSPHNPDHLVRTQHRRRRHTTLVWALAFAVIAVALAGMDHLGWFKSGDLAGLACAAVASVLIIRWVIRARRIDAGAVARDLDSQWSLQARLEAAAELSDNFSAFAAAQRADAAAKLAGHRVPRAFAWHAGQFVLIVALLLFLTESGIFGFKMLRAKPAPVLPPPAADIGASIEWRSPESELKATAIEEIALVAAADSRTGFRAMSLEVSVNGEPRLSRPLDAATLAALAKPGPHPVKLPLYLDEISAVEFDMVAYHLRADRTTTPPSPAVTSPLQFVQIRPAREDVEIVRPKGGQLGELAAIIGALKAAQLTLLKQNFLLSHAQIPKTDKTWTEANSTVANDQKTFAGKVAEARAFAISKELPALVVDNLTQIIPLSEEAAKKIGEIQNEQAARPQGHILGLLTEIEKLIRKLIIEGGGGGGKPPPPNPDPFKDEQRYKLPPRKSTPAGQLEQLAQDQTEQAKKTEPADPSSSPSSSPSEKKPPSAEEQAELARRAAALAKNQQLSEAAKKAAAQAARDAAAAENQLKQGDVSAARAPAQAAAQTLREAAAAQEKAGRDAARAQLEAARRALDAAAREPDAAARAAKLDAIAAELQAAARAQQESGSAEAARQLQAAALEAAKAAEAARKGTDAPGDQSGNEPGNKPGDINPGTQPGDQPGSKPGDQPGNTAVADPNGDRQMMVSFPGAGKDPGKEPGSGQGKEPGHESGQQPDKNGTGQTPGKGEGEGQGQGSGPGSGSGSIPRLVPADRAGQTAANAQAALSDRTETINRAVRQLERGSGSGPGQGTGPGQGASTPTPNVRVTDLVLGAQLAQAVLATPEAAKLANTIVNRVRREPSGAANVVMPADLRGAADRLRLLLAAALSDDRRDETVRRFNPEDIDPAYREAVEAYFERLSREARKP